MYTHLYVSYTDAERLFKKFGRKPLGPGESGCVTRSTLDEHFSEFGMTYIDRLDASLEPDRTDDTFVLKFSKYLPHVPRELVEMGIKVLRVEMVRYNSAPTSARAGYYESLTGFTATVENVVSTQNGKRVGAYAQNITLTGPSLMAAQQFNSQLSEGGSNHLLVNAFE